MRCELRAQCRLRLGRHHSRLLEPGQQPFAVADPVDFLIPRSRDRVQEIEVQLDLFRDYRNNVALYPAFQDYFRTHRPPLLAVWGKHDPFFLPAGAEAFRRDIPDAVVRFFDTGHFALETHASEIADAIREFLSR